MNHNLGQGSVQTDYLSYGYGLAIIAGGLMGYAKARSVPSLAAGLIFGAAATFGAYQASQDPRNINVILLTSGSLLTVMGMRFYKSGKFMPAGLIAGLSLLQFGRMGVRLTK